MIVDCLASYEQPQRKSRHTARLERHLHWNLITQFKFSIKCTVELRAFKAHGNVLRRPLGRTITVSRSPLPHNPRHSRGAHQITSILTSSMAVLSQWLRRVSDKAPAPKRKPSIGRKLHDEIMKSFLEPIGLTVMSYVGASGMTRCARLST